MHVQQQQTLVKEALGIEATVEAGDDTDASSSVSLRKKA
jgi:hypothetical protein